MSLERLYSFFFGNRFCYKWNRSVLKCALKGLGVDSAGIPSSELYLLKRVISPCDAPILFDVGANIGDWSNMALSIKPNSSIYAFEPGPKPFEVLKTIPNIRAFNLACGKMNESAFLYDRQDHPNFSHASLDYNVIARLKKGIKQYPVQIVTLDEIIHAEGIKRIDLLKIDVEGYEYEVLQGAKQALDRGIIQHIQFEFNEMNVFRRRFFHDFYELLPEFSFYRLLARSQIPLRRYDPMLHELFTYQNVLASRKRK